MAPHPQTSKAERFQWPPKPSVAVVAPADSPAHSIARQRVAFSTPRPTLWSAIEDTWLDVTARPLPQRSAEVGWTVDDPSDYCPRCGRTTHQAAPSGCHECRDIKLAWARMVRLGEFDGPLRTWVHEVKFTRWRRLGHDLGVMLGERLHEAYGAVDQAGLAAPPVIVPVPDSTARRLLRGIDHTMVIARGVHLATGWEIAQPLRRRLGPSQVSVAPSERSANVARSFGLRSDAGRVRLSGRVVVLVDDVCTTGATMRACGRLIASACRKEGKSLGGEVWAAILARTDFRKHDGTAGPRVS